MSDECRKDVRWKKEDGRILRCKMVEGRRKMAEGRGKREEAAEVRR